MSKNPLIKGWNEPAGRQPAVEEEQDDGRRNCEPRDQSQQRDRERTEADRGGSSPGLRLQQEPRRTGKGSRKKCFFFSGPATKRGGGKNLATKKK